MKVTAYLLLVSEDHETLRANDPGIFKENKPLFIASRHPTQHFLMYILATSVLARCSKAIARFFTTPGSLVAKKRLTTP